MSGDGPTGPEPLGSTYRLQLHGVGFDGAAAVVPYLHALGVEVLYLSPVLEAVAGSAHGYDVCDPTRLDPAFGGPDAFARLLEAVDRLGMRVLLDVVPNHLAASTDTPWWWDVLRLGRASAHARVFDIDWEAHDGRVLLPVLARPLDEVLADGDLSVRDDARGPVVAYGATIFPIDPATLHRPGRQLPSDACEVSDLLGRQHYRLAHWRLGPKEGNYRRFFDVAGLVGVRVEDPDVYAATHAVVLDLVGDQRVVGLRLDHVDGLADPGAYLTRLRADVDAAHGGPVTLVVEKILARGEDLPDGWPVDGTTGYEFADRAVSVLLPPSGSERRDGPEGDPAGGGDAVAPLEPPALAAKEEMLGLLFGSQFGALVAATVTALGPESGRDLARQDVARALALLVVHLPVYRTYLDGDPVRPEDDRLLTALEDEVGEWGEDDELERAVHAVASGLRRSAGPVGETAWREVARRYQQLSGALAAKGVEDTALYRAPGPVGGIDVGTPITPMPVPVDEFHEWAAGRASRLPGSLSATSTHDAKRSEDTRARLCVLAELGDRWEHRQRRWDSSEPVREHLAGRGLHLHDVHTVYQAVVGTWPDAGITDDGALAAYRQRITEYVRKAAREAKVATSWLDPDEGYEAQLTDLVGTLLATAGTPFVQDVARLVRSIGPASVTTGLALATLRICSPGVPDTYQGTEVWARFLVDPDNRSPVPFDELGTALSGIDGVGRTPAALAALLRAHPDGRVKLAVVSGLLRARRDRKELFADGAYQGLRVEGPAAAHVLAFARVSRDRPVVLAVVPRLPYRLAGARRFPVGPSVWADTRVAVPESLGDHWRDLLDGHTVGAPEGRLAVGSALATLPVAVLESATVGWRPTDGTHRSPAV